MVHDLSQYYARAEQTRERLRTVLCSLVGTVYGKAVELTDTMRFR